MDRESLDRLLLELDHDSDQRARTRAGELRRRLARAEIRILLVGEAKRGKSTLGNAMLGRDVLPSGVRPVTAISTAVSCGAPEGIQVHFVDGRTSSRPIEDLSSYVTEQENPSNDLGVASVVVTIDRLPVPGAVLVDTPGVGSVLPHNTDAAKASMNTMDVAVFVLTADPPVSRTELDLLAAVRKRAVATFVVLNKADRLEPVELADALAFASEVTGADEVIACSARAGLLANLAHDRLAFEASGVQHLLDQLGSRVREQGAHDLVASVGGAAVRTATGAVDRLRLTRAALHAGMSDRMHDVHMFADELLEASSAQDQALASIAWETGQIRRKLDEDAMTEVRRVTGRALQEVDAIIADAAVSVDSLESAAHASVERTTKEHVGRWRERWLTTLDESLVTLTVREQHILDRSADLVSSSARRLLGTDVRPTIEPLRTPDPPDLHFDFSPEVGWNTPVADQVRRRLPPRWRRQVNASRIRSQAVAVVDKHFGRARSDVQRRLESAHRDLSREVTLRFYEQREGLSDALAAATRAKDETHEQQDARLAGLDARLGSLVSLLERVAPDARTETKPDGPSVDR